MNVEQINKVLAEIQASVPEGLRKSLFIESYKNPILKFVLEKALEDPNLPQEKREKYELLLRNEASAKKVEINPRIAKMIDDRVEREIKKAIKAGRLPPRNKLGEIDFIKRLNELQYGQENN